MNISILAGKCQEDNLNKIFEILKARDKTKNNYIIAPDRSLFSIERRLFDELKEDCFFDISVMSFSKLAKKCSNLKNDKNILTKQSGVALVKKLLNENKDKLLTFGKACDFMGFATNLFETICLFKSCNISCDEIYTDDSSDYSNLKQKDIKLIYTEYEKFLKNDFTDSFNQLKLFADVIDSDFCKNTNFYIVEFDDFTSLMYLIISKLCRFSNSVYISSTFGKENTNSNIYTNKVYYNLIDTLKFEGLNFKIDKIENNDILVNNLLAYSPKKSTEKCENFEITQFENINQEIKYTIASIYNIARLNKTDFGNFAIVLPSIQTYKQLLVSELDKYNIPYYIDQSECIKDHVLIRTLFDICNLFSGKFMSYDILNILKNQIFQFDYDCVLDYDNYLNKTGLRGFTCLNYDSGNSEINQFFAKILEWKELSKTKKTTGEYIEIVKYIFDYIISLSEGFVKGLSPLENRIFVQVINKFDSLTEDYLSVFGNDETSFAQFLEVYFSYFDSTNISLPPITNNTVFVADFESSYVSKYDYIYILGCVEGKLPSFKVDNGLITDEEIDKLPYAKRINPTIALLNARKTFKLFELCFKHKKKCFLSFYIASGDGKCYPNNLIKSISSICDLQINNGSEKLDFLDKNIINWDINSVIFNNQSKSVMIDNVLTLAKNWEVYSHYPNYLKLISLLANCVGEEAFDLIDNNYSSVRQIFLRDVDMFRNSTTSISQIETYFNCPYKHFARYGLRLNKKENYEFKPNDIGTIIHSILKYVMPNILNKDTIENIMNVAYKRLDYILQSENYKNLAENPVNKYIIKALKQELQRIVVGIVDQLSVSTFRPNLKYLEYSFVDNSLSDNNIKIKGAIDRVDTMGDRFIIIDYKTGDSNFDNYTDVYSGKKLQLLFYAKAFEKISKLKSSGAFYLPITNNFFKTKESYKFIGVLDKDINNIYGLDKNLMNAKVKSSVINLSTTQSGEFAKNSAFFNRMCLSTEDYEFLLNYATRQVNFAIKEILKGNITPNPLKTDNSDICSYCEYMGLCNYGGNNDRCVKSVASIEDLKTIEENNKN